MGYRFVKITTFYHEYLADYYGRNPKVGSSSYNVQYDHLISEAFGWADFYAKNLRDIGVDAHEIIANAVPLQKAWADERGTRTLGKNIVIEQLRALKPDVVLIQDTSEFNGDWVNALKKTVPSIKQVIGWCSYPYTNDHLRLFKVFDYMLTCTPGFVLNFAKSGIKAYLLYHAFEDSLLPRINKDNNYQEVDLLFAGSLGITKGYHNARKELIEELLDSGIILNIYTKINTMHPVYLLLKQGAYVTAATLRRLGLIKAAQTLPWLKRAFVLDEFPRQVRYSKQLKQTVRPPIYGLEMLRALSRAKIGFNIHIDCAGKYAGNVRLFEVTGVGSCLLTDWKVNLHEIFELDKEIMTYSSPEECIEKVKWLINNPRSRNMIAQAGMKRTLRDHTYALRAEQLNDIIINNFN